MPPYEVEGSEARSRRDLIASLVWIIASIFLLVLPLPAQQWVSSALRATVLAPFVWTQEGVNRTRIRAVEIEVLQARLDSTVALLSSQSMLAAENARLRALMGLRERASPAFVPASAIRPGTRGSESTFLLDVGSNDGVSVNDPVVSADGFVGVIREVAPNNALAMDWTHPDFSVTVTTLDGETFGTVEVRQGAFREEDRLILDGIPFYTVLEEGEVLVTSGQGIIYPRGIRVGTILSLAEAEAGWRRGYWVEPAVRVGSVTHVLVITGVEGTPVSDLTHLWEGESAEAGDASDEREDGPDAGDGDGDGGDGDDGDGGGGGGSDTGEAIHDGDAA